MGNSLKPDNLKMKLAGAYAMCVLGGTDQPSCGDVKKVLEAAGYEMTDEESTQLEELVEEMAGKTFYDVVSAGREKLESCAGAACGGSGAAAPAAADGGDDKPAEKPPSSSSDAGGGAGMFDDD